MENNSKPILTMESFKVAVSDIDRVYKDTFCILKVTYDKAKEEMVPEAVLFKKRRISDTERQNYQQQHSKCCRQKRFRMF